MECVFSETVLLYGVDHICWYHRALDTGNPFTIDLKNRFVNALFLNSMDLQLTHRTNYISNIVDWNVIDTHFRQWPENHNLDEHIPYYCACTRSREPEKNGQFDEFQAFRSFKDSIQDQELIFGIKWQDQLISSISPNSIWKPIYLHRLELTSESPI